MVRKRTIVTKTGDKGYSKLYTGEKISKDSLRLEILGDIDELICVLGIARSIEKKKNIKKMILDIQKDLFVLNAEIASNPKKLSKLKKRIDISYVKSIEISLESVLKKKKIPSKFIIPAETVTAAYLHLSRAIARRCERKIVKLFKKKEIKNKAILIWINRLSDYLFLIANLVEINPNYIKYS